MLPYSIVVGGTIVTAVVHEAVTNILDIHVIGEGSALRGAVIAFYVSNEALSLFDNAAHFGLPVADLFKNALAQLHGRDGKDEKSSGK